jgi:hypothetical protein
MPKYELKQKKRKKKSAEKFDAENEETAADGSDKSDVDKKNDKNKSVPNDIEEVYMFQRKVVVTMIVIIVLMLAICPIIITLHHRKIKKEHENMKGLLNDVADTDNKNNGDVFGNSNVGMSGGLINSVDTNNVSVPTITTPIAPTPIPLAHTVSTPPTAPVINVNNLAAKINSLNDTTDENNTVKIPTTLNEFF